MKHFVVLVLFALTGCGSNLILHPGLRGRFIEEDTGQPIVGVRVEYKDIGSATMKTVVTDLHGGFEFPPEFTRGYAGFPTSPIGLQVSCTLMLHDRDNPNYAYFFVKNTDVGNATIDAGEIKIPRVFLMNTSNNSLQRRPLSRPR